MGILACRTLNVVSPIKCIKCKHCESKINFYNKESVCFECQNHFCNACLKKYMRTSQGSICLNCLIRNERVFSVSHFMNLKICDLKWFLNSRTAPNYGSNLRDNTRFHSSSQSRPPSASNASDQSSSRPHSISMSTLEQRFNDIGETLEEMREAAYSNISTPAIKIPPPENELSTITIQDVKTAAQIDELTVRQLKLLLVRNYVDFRGCCEKQDLKKKVLELWHQSQQNKAKEKDMDDENLCKLCMAAAIDCVLLECGHMATCTSCGKRLPDCPICRQFVSRVVHIFKA